MSWTGSENNRKEQGTCEPPTNKPVGTAKPYANRKRRMKQRPIPRCIKWHAMIAETRTHEELSAIARTLKALYKAKKLSPETYCELIAKGRQHRDRLRQRLGARTNTSK